MLLPSAMDCAPGIQPMRSIYTTTTSAIMSPPQSHRQPTAFPKSTISSCRALQSLITTNLSSQPVTSKAQRAAPPSLASPIALTSRPRASHKNSSKTILQPTSANAQTPRTPPRTSKKRLRSEFDDEDDNGDPKTPNQTKPTAPSTPKRQRICPPTLPQGLTHADFQSLQATAAAIPIPCTPSPKSTSPHQQTMNPEHWNENDDSALVSLILRKLQLKQEDWEECAKKLGKGRDSIGERFRVLVGSGEVGLRRGAGRRSRGGLGEMGFGGPLPDVSR